jgi:hypothetical protein
MEHMVRVQNESDRKILAWLRERMGAAALAQAIDGCDGPGKPYLSQVCRRLGMRPPWTVSVSTARESAHMKVGDLHLTVIRQTLGQLRKQSVRA